MFENTTERDRVFMAALELPGQPVDFSELKALVEAAEGEVVGEMVQAKSNPDPGIYFGSGKVLELRDAAMACAATLVVVDSELSPAQIRNLEDKLDLRVIDRTQLILDIFGQRAKSHEGRLQVEIAQLSYALPRLTGRGKEMSRLGASVGIRGTRGPGESKLEYDRRRIRESIAQLRNEIKELRRHRQLLRENRTRRGYPLVALVGYTNAGKSTLLNTLTEADAFAADMLFATLDTTTRVLALPDGREVAITDTVGFISRLPHMLVEAFHATLEEVQEADLLIHVVDASNAEWHEQMEAVHQVLKELKSENKPQIVAYNKVDLLAEMEQQSLSKRAEPSVLISAATGSGLEQLKQLITQNLPNMPRRVTYLLPYTLGEVPGWLHRQGEVVEQEYTEEGMRIIVDLQEAQIRQLVKQYNVLPLEGVVAEQDAE